MLFAGAACFVLSRAIAAPINGMSAFMGRLADGHSDDMTANQERGDEIGMTAKSVEFFLHRLIANRAMQARAGRENEEKATPAKSIENLKGSVWGKRVAERVSTVGQRIIK